MKLKYTLRVTVDIPGDEWRQHCQDAGMDTDEARDELGQQLVDEMESTTPDCGGDVKCTMVQGHAERFTEHDVRARVNRAVAKVARNLVAAEVAK